VQLARDGRPYEEDLLRLVVGLTADGDHILDIGANIGNHTVYWAKAGRSVTAFEPNPPIVKLLRSNISRNHLEPNVTVRAQALGASEAHGSTHQILDGNVGSVEVVAGQGEIDIVPLDTIVLSRPALIKIDVEGHESEVITGAVRSLQEWRPLVVAEGSAVGDLLRSLGYHRLPWSFAATPTFVYAPSATAAVRVALSKPFLVTVARRAAVRTSERLPIAVQAKLQRRFGRR
jgi:FkbM family methyltransferase